MRDETTDQLANARFELQQIGGHEITLGQAAQLPVSRGVGKNQGIHLALGLIITLLWNHDPIRGAEEFGLNREDLGAPWSAAIISMVAFSLGAIVPLLPYLFGENDLSFMLSGVLSAAALVTVGAGLAWMSGINWVWGSVRMLIVGSAAAAVTFGIGSAIGQAIS